MWRPAAGLRYNGDEKQNVDLSEHEGAAENFTGPRDVAE
jgi:hypothetical protein